MKGLFYGGGTTQLMSQAIGSGAVTVATLVVAFVLMYAVKATGTLRVSKAGELEGLDLHEHGMTAYPEFPTAFSPSLTHHSSGMASQSVSLPSGTPARDERQLRQENVARKNRAPWKSLRES